MGGIVTIDFGFEEFLRYTGKKWLGKQVREIICIKSGVNSGRIQVQTHT